MKLKYTDNRDLGDLRPPAGCPVRAGGLYVDATHIPKVLGGMGTTILSTSHGVMTGHEARAAGVGGEVVAEVW